MKCVFTCSIFVNSNTKRFLSVFRCFWKVFCLKNLKISKTQFCPVLATQSRVSQVASLSRVFAGHFWRLVTQKLRPLSTTPVLNSSSYLKEKRKNQGHRLFMVNLSNPEQEAHLRVQAPPWNLSHLIISHHLHK